MISMLLVLFSERHSAYEISNFGEKTYIRKEKLLFFIMAAYMSIFVGLRTFYNDTGTYRGIYNSLSANLNLFERMDWAIGSNPGFMLTNRVLKHLGFSVQSFTMFYAVITVGIYLWFIHKYSTDLVLSIFLFYTMGCYTFTMAAIKQCIAVAFCLVAVDRELNGERKKFFFWILLATTFHPYSLMYLIVPFLFFSPWTNRTFYLLGIFFVAGIALQPLLGTVVSITSMMGEEYDVASFQGEGVNVYRLGVIWAPVLLSALGYKFFRQSTGKTMNLALNLTMLNAEIMFVALFGTANYFARLANYFLFFQCISLPWIIQTLNERSKRLITLLVIMMYSAYFYYANAINQVFDKLFNAITFSAYLKELLLGGLV